jgi:hypothetical protein
VLNDALDPSTLAEDQEVMLRCPEVDSRSLKSVFSHRIAELYFFVPPDGGSGIILMAHDDGTLRDQRMKIVEVLRVE